VSHLPLELAYDPELLAVEKVERDAFLGPESEAQILTDRSRPGRILVGASRLGAAPGVDGTGTLLRITFRALAEGETELTFAAAAARDAGLAPLPLAVEPARVTVSAAAPPPPRRDPELFEGGRPRRPASPET
jgi:hypothetical protein